MSSFLHLLSTEIAALGKAVRQGEKALAGKEEVVAVERTSQRQIRVPMYKLKGNTNTAN